jgi:hypothetical protein
MVLDRQKVTINMLAYQMSSLMAVAVSVGIESNNPEGGLSHDSKDEDIIETIVDIANGSPHSLGIEMDNLTENQCDMVVRAFYDGAYDRS